MQYALGIKFQLDTGWILTARIRMGLLLGRVCRVVGLRRSHESVLNGPFEAIGGLHAILLEPVDAELPNRGLKPEHRRIDPDGLFHPGFIQRVAFVRPKNHLFVHAHKVP